MSTPDESAARRFFCGEQADQLTQHLFNTNSFMATARTLRRAGEEQRINPPPFAPAPVVTTRTHRSELPRGESERTIVNVPNLNIDDWIVTYDTPPSIGDSQPLAEDLVTWLREVTPSEVVSAEEAWSDEAILRFYEAMDKIKKGRMNVQQEEEVTSTPVKRRRQLNFD